MTLIFKNLTNFCTLDESGKQRNLDRTSDNLYGKMELQMSKKFKTNVEKFILFNMTPKKANKEAQKLIRDFNIAEVALFMIK